MALILFSNDIIRLINQEILIPLEDADFKTASVNIEPNQKRLYENIPKKKRISYGRYYTIKSLGRYLVQEIEERDLLVFEFADYLSSNYESPVCLGVAMGLLACDNQLSLDTIFPIFLKAASSQNWQAREHASGLIRPLIKKYPQEFKANYLDLVESENANIRRFVSESLRPVQENCWFHSQPDYAISILEKLYYEKDSYPRTSVGNNLSDWSRKYPEMVYQIIDLLVKSGDPNAHWIATRACRNLVKKEPIRVMEILGVEEYRYKDRYYNLKEIKQSLEESKFDMDKKNCKIFKV